MTAPVVRLAPQLDNDVPPPTWGEDFRRIRKSVFPAVPSLLAALEQVGIDTSTATISRLEGADEPPQEEQREIVAVATLVLCGKHPSVLGLSIDALPRRIYAAIFGEAPDDPGGLEVSRRACNGATILDFRARQVSPATRESIAA